MEVIKMDMKETSQEHEVRLVYVDNLNKAKKEMEELICSAKKKTEGFALLIPFVSLFIAIGYRSCLRTLGIEDD